MTLIKTIMVLSTCFLVACSSVKERYLLTVLTLPEQANSTWLDENTSHVASITQAGGRLLSPILKVEKELVNDAQPSYTGTLPGNAIALFAFPDQQHVASYLSKTVNQPAQYPQAIKAIYLAEAFSPMGMMDNYPSLDTIHVDDKEAFIMVNGIQMRSFLNPMTPWRIMRHMMSTTPTLTQSNVQFIRPFKITQTLYGEDNLEVLFLTLWPSEAIFYALHNDQAFVEFTRANRNKAFSHFTESKTLFIAP